MTYAEKLKDPRWQKKRLLICERDGWKCRNCDDASKTLHVHHCHYVKGNPWDTPDELLLTLCASCHDARQVVEEEGKYALAQIFAHLEGAAEGSSLSAFVSSLQRVAITMRSGTEFIPEVWDQTVVINLWEKCNALERKLACPTAT